MAKDGYKLIDGVRAKCGRVNIRTISQLNRIIQGFTPEQRRRQDELLQQAEDRKRLDNDHNHVTTNEDVTYVGKFNFEFEYKKRKKKPLNLSNETDEVVHVGITTLDGRAATSEWRGFRPY